MTVFLTSDTHFGHTKIIEHCKRPFSSVEEMDEVMIERWNAAIGLRDEVWHLGDFAFRTPDMRRYFDQLNGRKKLIFGNHDDETTRRLAWDEVRDYAEVKLNKQKIVLFHYPIQEWNGAFRGSIHAHGHQHNPAAVTGSHGGRFARFDVGVDAWNFTPIPAETLLTAWAESGVDQ